jgi:hypothetical protein
MEGSKGGGRGKRICGTVGRWIERERKIEG